MNRLQSILHAHINENERHLLARKNGRDPKVKGSELARLLGEKNSGGEDTVLADISMDDARLLKILGGAGTVDPDTKRVHFYDGDTGSGNGDNSGIGGGDSGDDTDGSPDSGQPEGSFTAGFTTGPDTNEFGDLSDVGSFTGGFSDGRSAGEFDDPDEANRENDPYANLDEDGTGKGRADSAFGKGGELESLGSALQGWASSMNMGSAYDAASSKKGNEMLTNFLGYDPSKADISGSPGYTYHGNASWMTGAVRGDRNEAASTLGRGEDELDSTFSGSRQSGPSTLSVSDMPGITGVDEDGNTQYQSNYGPHIGHTEDQVGRAGHEYNMMGYRDQLTAKDEDENVVTATPWSYTGLDNRSHTNWGSIGSDAVSAFGGPVMGGIAAATGLGPLWSVINSGLQATKGNFAPGISHIAGTAFGPQGALAANTLQSILNGTPGNTIANLGAGYLNTVAPGAGALLGATGLTGRAASGINDVYQTALNDAINADTPDGLSSEGTGAFGTGSVPSEFASLAEDDTGGPGDGIGDAAGAGGGSGGGGMGGGGGSSEFSDYEQIKDPFLVSKKKSRYRRPNSLAAILGDDTSSEIAQL